MKMQKLFLLLFICVITGCRKQQIPTTLHPPLLNTAESFNRSEDFDTKVQTYSLLTATEKYQLWSEHFKKAKKQFELSGNKEKVSLVSELLSTLTVNLFNTGTVPNSEQDIFLNYTIPLWNIKAETVFTDLELYDLTYDPTVKVIGEKVAPPDMGELPTENSPRCFCHVGTRGYTCKKLSVGFPSGVTFIIGVCEKTDSVCEYTRSGCGFMWFFSCNGNHCNF